MNRVLIHSFLIQTFLVLAWVLGSIYASVPVFWLGIHPFASYWRNLPASPYRLLAPAWALEIGVILAATWPWHGERIYESSIAWVPALMLFACGASLYYQVHRFFSPTKLIGKPQLRSDSRENELVIEGIHARMRHPTYLAHLSMMAAFTVASGLLVLYVLLPMTLVTGAWMIRQEDRELEERFGEEFREYKRRAPAFAFWPRRPAEFKK